jgi:hypothetical protein
MSGSIPLLKKGAHLALSANEEVRMGASGSAGEGTRLESAVSLERTFEGPGCGGRTAPLSPALDSQRFRCPSVPLPSGLRGDTTGVSLRFSRCHELFIIIHDREDDKPITVLGATWCQDVHVRPPPFGLLEARGVG